MNISVIIPTYNRLIQLKETLKYLYECGIEKKDEVIIINDGGEKISLGKNLFANANIKIIEYNNNKGPASARNIGIKNAKNEILLFIGDDIIPDKNFIKKHKIMHKKYYKNNYAILGKIEWFYNLNITPFMRYITDIGGQQFSYFTIKNKEQEVDYGKFYTSNISLKRGFLLKNGLFDEIFPFAAYEDIELGYRLTKKGLKIIYNSDIIGYHNHFITLDSFLERQYKAGFCSYFFIQKYPEFYIHVDEDKYLNMKNIDEKINKLKKEIKNIEKSQDLELEKLYKKYKEILSLSADKGLKDAIMSWKNNFILKGDGENWNLFLKTEDGRILSVHSRNIHKETKILLKNVDNRKPVLFIGSGLSEHIKEWLEKTERQVYLFEPDNNLYEILIRKTNEEKIIRLKNIDDYKNSPIFNKEKNICILPVLKNNNTIYAKFYEQILKEKYQINIKNKKKLKIMVVTPLYGGSYEISYYITDGFKKNNTDVFIYDTSHFYNGFEFFNKEFDNLKEELQKKYLGIITESIYIKAIKEKVDVVFCIAQAPVGKEILSLLRKKGIITAFWFVENFRVLTYWKDIYRDYDFFFTIQNGEFLKILKEKKQESFFIPLAGIPNNKEPEKFQYKWEISFVGAPYKNRVNILANLNKLNISIFGEGWNNITSLNGLKRKVVIGNRRLNSKEIHNIYKTSKININIHSSPFYDEIEKDKDFINPRTFEILSMGGFQLVDYRNNIEKFFDVGKEIEIYKDIPELIDKINFYLKHEDKRKKLALNGLYKIKEKHTYYHRAHEILKILLRR